MHVAVIAGHAGVHIDLTTKKGGITNKLLDVPSINVTIGIRSIKPPKM
jgi:hypothetical protein